MEQALDNETDQGAPGARAFTARRVWTLESHGHHPLEDHAVLTSAGRVQAVVPAVQVPGDTETIDLGDLDLAPGFVDVQVNGGGGVLFNDAPTVEGIRAIAEAHRAFGTTSLLPTLITDGIDVIARARGAINDAVVAVPGVIGVHFEGPFLDERKTGAHDPAYVRCAAAEDLDAMFSGALGVTVVTAAANKLEDGTLETILSRGGIVCLGHCASTFDEASRAFARGATGVTHLYNAMSALGSRAPGLVGAAFASDGAYCGLIADGIHVAYGAARAAWKALGTERMMLVTDAVQPVGTEMTEFALGGQRVRIEDGACINEDGNLAGSALDMASAVRNAVCRMGVPLGSALAMASATPAAFLGMDGEVGRLVPGSRADLVALDGGLRVRAVVQGGRLTPLG